MLCLLVSCLSTSRRRLVFPILRMPDSENPILFLEESLRDKLGDEFLSSYKAASRRAGENSLLVDDNRGQKGPSCCAADVAAQAQADYRLEGSHPVVLRIVLD